MGKIVLSYRREDAKTITNWLHEKLVERYGRDAIFRDIDSIQPTENFKKRIGRALKDCDFVVAVIGPAWHGPTGEGQSRINSANDWVRVEIETALQLDIPLLPVLVEDAEMPDPEALPASLREITEIHALPIASGGARFHEDLNRLFTAIDRTVGVVPEAPPQAAPPEPTPEPKPSLKAEPPQPPPEPQRAETPPSPLREPSPPPRSNPAFPSPPLQPEASRAPAPPGSATAAGPWVGGSTASGAPTNAPASSAEKLFAWPSILTLMIIPAVFLVAVWFFCMWVLGLTPLLMMVASAVLLVLLGNIIRRIGGVTVVGALVIGAIVGAAAILPIATRGPRSDEWPIVILLLVGGGALASGLGYLLAAASRAGSSRSK